MRLYRKKHSFVCLKDKILFRPEMHLLFKIGLSVIILQSNSTDMAVIVWIRVWNDFVLFVWTCVLPIMRFSTKKRWRKKNIVKILWKKCYIDWIILLKKMGICSPPPTKNCQNPTKKMLYRFNYIIQKGGH